MTRLTTLRVLLLLCLLPTATIAVGCKAVTQQKTEAIADEAGSPFVGVWEAFRSDSEYAEDVESMTLRVDGDGFILATIVLEGKEQVSIPGDWSLEAGGRMDSMFRIEEFDVLGYAWIKEDRVMAGTLVVPEEDYMSISIDFRRIEE
ncbi:MAG: hypothetical protein AAGC44_12535 [Planctomycetota bacterium]